MLNGHFFGARMGNIKVPKNARMKEKNIIVLLKMNENRLGRLFTKIVL